MSDTLEGYVAGLRELANYLETTEIGAECLTYNALRIDIFTYTEESFRERSRKLGGAREKILSGPYAITRRRFGPHAIDVNISRDTVCEKVQTGTKIVPAQEAVPEHEEPVYEWHCEGFTVNA